MKLSARALFWLAVAATPADSRARRREQWAADLAEASAVGLSAFTFSVGLVIAAGRLRVALDRRRAVGGALVVSIAALSVGCCIGFAETHQPECAAPRSTLDVVTGINTTESFGPLPERAQLAVRAVRASGGYEGVWVEPDGGVKIGVYGPSWSRARSAAIAVAATPGPTISYVCQPATARQLAAAQSALGRSPLWQQRVIGFSNIDVKNATVTVAITGSAPRETEASLIRAYGPRLDVERSSNPFADIGPGRGRMPLATDSSGSADH